MRSNHYHLHGHGHADRGARGGTAEAISEDSNVNGKSGATRRVTGVLLGIGLYAVCTYSGPLQADEIPNRFDGEWTTILSCANASGALGYSFEFLSRIHDGVLHGEKGVKGEPGWLQLDGAIPPDGHANIYASGLVGASEAAVGHRPAGTQYGYHVDVKFTSDTSGMGHRVEGRPCTVSFNKKP
jgi:hypothetical protein